MGEAKRRRQRQANAPKVALGYVHGDAGRVTSFEESRDALVGFDLANQRLFAHDNSRITVRCGTDGLPAARNTIAARVVAADVDWLLWVDTDMGFAPDSLYRLMQVADPVKRPIVGGLCFAQRQYAHDGLNGYRTKPMPTIYDWVEADDGVARFRSVPLYPVNGLVRTAATGSAFVLVHRSVFERIAERVGPTWYDRTPGPDGKLLGEDISFCVRAAALEIPIHVHTGVRTSHYKGQWVSEADHWLRYVPPPATGPTAVIVPVLRRPQNAEPFMRSLRASTGLATVYAVFDEDCGDSDTRDAWSAAGAELIPSNRLGWDEFAQRPDTFARKVNLGYAKTAEPWLFVTGDDVRFHPGWLDHAQHAAESLDAAVVGTNDLGNPRVLAGEHGTHLLIRRSYVDERGASWDGPGVVCHEGYQHWYVDDEIVTAAKQRGVWQSALGSVVEHLHPLWGKGEPDPVYELGQASADVDRALWERRSREHRR